IPLLTSMCLTIIFFFSDTIPSPPSSTLFPYTTLFRSRYGNGTLRVTTRQDNQFHGVVKGDLKRTIRALNNALVTTLGACGDERRSEEHTSELHHVAISYAVFCLKKKKQCKRMQQQPGR